jgi:hypothetical protein
MARQTLYRDNTYKRDPGRTVLSGASSNLSEQNRTKSTVSRLIENHDTEKYGHGSQQVRNEECAGEYQQ